MDGIPVMSRAACRNHAVRTLGCVNQMACVVTYGKGDHAMARNAGDKRWTRHKGHHPHIGRYLYGDTLEITARAMQLSHTCRYGVDRCRVI